MLDDLRNVPAGAELEADVCVVGAGAAGIAIAREFISGKGRVIVLESGGLRTAPATESLKQGESNGISADSLTEGRGRVLGGATALWAGQCIPPDQETFAQRPWVPLSGWPFGEAELTPFMSRAEALFGIEAEVYDERIWGRFGVRPPAIDRDLLTHRFTVWCPEPHLGRLYRRELEQSKSVRILLHATTKEILTSAEGDRFVAVEVATPEGKSVHVRAQACVLACGAIENSRLMLTSHRYHAGGIGNAHDLVGRFFQEHPNGHTAVIETSDPRRLQELYGLLYRGRVRYLPRLELSPAVQRAQQVLGCAAHPVFHFGEGSGIEAARRVYRELRARRRPSGLRRELRRMARDAATLVPVAYRRVAHGRSADVRPLRVTLQTHGEQAPNPSSRVTLTRRRDRLGVPVPRVDWKLTELDRRTAQVMVWTVGEEFQRLGLGGLRPESWLESVDFARHMSDAYHHMGTTRLGSDPKTSVVDPNGQVHGVRGLFVTGSSVFPTAGSANPTLTIAALAIRLADHLRTILGPGR